MTMPCSTPNATTPTVATSERRSESCRTRRYTRRTRDVDQGERGGDQHGGQRRLREVLEERGQEHEQRDEDGGAHQTSDLGLGARLRGDGGPRAADRDREALKEAGGDVRRPDADHLLVGVDLVAATGGEARRRRDRVGQRHQHDAQRGDASASARRTQPVHGNVGEGSPAGSVPTVATPYSARPKAAVTTVAPTTATSTAGTRLVRRGRPKSTAKVASPTTSVVTLVSIEPREEGLHLGDEPVGVGREAEELGQLADDDGDRQPVHVADLHLLREQVGDEAELAEPKPISMAPTSSASMPAKAMAVPGSSPPPAARSPRRSGARRTSPGRAPARATAPCSA